MNIGFVSTWLQRGAAYVTINYIKMIKEKHNVFVYARGGEYFDESFHFDSISIHRGLRLESTEINIPDFIRWTKSNKLDIVVFNEQDSIEPICYGKIECPNVIFGAYIDYYKESTIRDFSVYDFLICNTRRHYSVFSWHPQCFYLPWGTDIDLYSPRAKENEKKKKNIVFFHSMGMSARKGTEILIETFIENRLSSRGAKLLIHTQKNISYLISDKQAADNGIEIINKSVSAPGLYYLGDVYVYPAKLDGLGLTMYEALSCGLPVIATDVAPMNEVVNNGNGKLVNVCRYYSRSDGYYWPLAEVDKQSLRDAMVFYIEHLEELDNYSKEARQYAVENLDLKNRSPLFLNFIEKVRRIDNHDFCLKKISEIKKIKKTDRMHSIAIFFPPYLQSFIREKIEKRRRNRNEHKS